MKIIVNATILDDKPTGLGVYTLNVIKELSMILKGGDSLIVYTGCPEALDFPGIKIRRVNRFVQPKYGRIAGVMRFLWLQLLFPLRALMEGFDVIYNTTHHGILFAFKRKQIITIQNDVEVTFKFPEQHILQYYYFKYVIPYLLRKSFAVITTSKYAKDTLLKYYGERIANCHYAYNSYNKDIFNPVKNPEDEKILKKYGLKDSGYLLNVGASYAHKNAGKLLAAYKEVQKKYRDISLCIVGYDRNYLDPLIENAGTGRIVKIPYVPQEEMVMLYRRAACLVFPSLYESFGIPGVEAMASGCPVIVSNISAFPEICEDAALYCNPYDANDIADKIEQLFTDNKLKDNLRGKGLERAKKFSWEDTARKIYQIMQEAYKTSLW
jgi:glycosyltransferase involved in cell wall biosynthesis